MIFKSGYGGQSGPHEDVRPLYCSPDNIYYYGINVKQNDPKHQWLFTIRSGAHIPHILDIPLMKTVPAIIRMTSRDARLGANASSRYCF